MSDENGEKARIIFMLTHCPKKKRNVRAEVYDYGANWDRCGDWDYDHIEWKCPACGNYHTVSK